jgi:NAD(P)-dependent dehydrogenase (short-subunit alcohol dehydrogenase family)
MSVNVDGVVNTMAATLESVISTRGQIVVVSSVFAYINGAGAIPYAMSKAAVEQLGRGLGVELASHGASAMTAYFSLIETDMIRQGVDADPHALALLSAMPKFHTQANPAADRRRRDRRRAGAPATFRHRPRPLAAHGCASRCVRADRRREARARCRRAASPCPT